MKFDYIKEIDIPILGLEILSIKHFILDSVSLAVWERRHDLSWFAIFLKFSQPFRGWFADERRWWWYRIGSSGRVARGEPPSIQRSAATRKRREINYTAASSGYVYSLHPPEASQDSPRASLRPSSLHPSSSELPP